MGNYTILYMFENPRRGRQARNFTTNVPKILDVKSSSEQIFSEDCRWVPLTMKRLHVARENHWTQDKAQQELLITLNYNLFSVINSIMISSVSYLDRLKLEFCYASHMKSLTFGLALNHS